MNDKHAEALTHALLELGFGDRKNTPGPGAIEAVAMALRGPGNSYDEGKSVSDGLFAIASAIDRVADAISAACDGSRKT